MLVVDLCITWQFIATHWVVRQFPAKSGPPLVMTCTMSQPAQQCNWATRRDPQVDVGPRLPTTSTARTLASTMQLGRQERSTPSNTCVRCDSNLLPHCHCATLVSAQILFWATCHDDGALKNFPNFWRLPFVNLCPGEVAHVAKTASAKFGACDRLLPPTFHLISTSVNDHCWLIQACH